MTVCANGQMCVDASAETNECGWAVRSPICDGCADVAGRDVRALAVDFIDLAQIIGRTSGSALGVRVSGTAERPLPIAEGVDALQRLIVHELTTWEPAVRERADLSAEVTRGVRPGWAVATAVAVIGPRIHVLASVPPTWVREGLAVVERNGLEAVERLRGLHRRARGLLGLTRLVTRVPGDCSACGMWTLDRENGTEKVRCASCGAAWSADEYRRYVGLLVSDYRDRAGP